MPGRRILILDDDAEVGRTIQWMAESLDFEAEFVSDSFHFFQRLDETNPDIVTIDLVMPELDGVEVMRLLAERKCRARIIISSGMGTRVLDAAKRSAGEHGLDILGILSKPISREALRRLAGGGSDGLRPVRAEKEAAAGDQSGITKGDLQRALECNELFVVYQPKIACASGVPAGFEALVRWDHPERGLVMPLEFVPVAEETGLIDALTSRVLDLGLEWLSHAFPAGNMHLALNVSAKNLVDLQLADRLAGLCKDHEVLPERIVLELTETSAMVDPILSLDLMTRFRVKGFQLSIDDFGTGYSSMVQLVRLPFSEIKVDRSFVMTANHSRESRTVVKSIVDLGHSLGMTVTAEGVEDFETFNYLNRLGCDLAQGYFIARPMAGEAARNWVTQRPAGDA